MLKPSVFLTYHGHILAIPGNSKPMTPASVLPDRQ